MAILTQFIGTFACPSHLLCSIFKSALVHQKLCGRVEMGQKYKKLSAGTCLFIYLFFSIYSQSLCRSGVLCLQNNANAKTVVLCRIFMVGSCFLLFSLWETDYYVAVTVFYDMEMCREHF